MTWYLAAFLSAVFAAIILKERITFQAILGIIFMTAGAIMIALAK